MSHLPNTWLATDMLGTWIFNWRNAQDGRVSDATFMQISEHSTGYKVYEGLCGDGGREDYAATTQGLFQYLRESGFELQVYNHTHKGGTISQSGYWERFKYDSVAEATRIWRKYNGGV